jgi:hypothetical protein
MGNNVVYLILVAICRRYGSTSREMGMLSTKEVGGKEQRVYYDSGILLYIISG